MPDTESAAPGALLLCLDLQPAFIDALPDGDALLRRCTLAISAAEGLGLPVLFTEQMPQKLGGTTPALTQLSPSAPVCAKAAFSALADDGLREQILAGGTEHLILCGLETPICVYQTAIDALNENLQVTVLTDAVGARRPADADHALASLARLGVHILPVETVFYALLHDARHPFFKTFTRLVKKAHG